MRRRLSGRCSLVTGKAMLVGEGEGGRSVAYLDAVFVIPDAVGCYWWVMAMRRLSIEEYNMTS